ncbi:MAG: hypothetical protein JNM63_16430 [Spirochaetia bacterium]|nr:hypothetical protein [Spirochaetia bacterium]
MKNLIFLFAACFLLLQPLAAANKIRIGVNYFEVVSGIDPNLKSSLAVLLESKLASTGRFTLLDRANIDKVLKEQAFQQGGCSDSACAVKLGNILGVQKMVIGNLIKISKRYKVVVKFLDVEQSSLDEVVGTVEEWAGSEEELEKAVERVAQTIAERVPLSGQVVQIDTDGVYVNIGKADKIEDGTEVEVKRTSEKIIDQSTGQVLGVKNSLIAKGKLTDLQPLLSRMVLVDNKGQKPNVRLKDEVYVVITEKFKKEQGDKNYKLAKAYLQNKNYDEAKSMADKALSYQPNNRDFQSLKQSIEKQIDDENIRQADAKERERIRQQQIDDARRASSSRSSGRSFSSSSSRRDGLAAFAGVSHFRPSSDTEFGKYFSMVNGVNLGIDLGSKESVFTLVGKHYFFLNQTDPAKVTTPYKTVQAIMTDLHALYSLRLQLGFLVPHAGIGAFYRYFVFRIDDDSITGGTTPGVMESRHWGLGVEGQAGLMIDFGGFGLDFKVGYELSGIIPGDSSSDLFSSSSSSSTSSTTSGLSSEAKQKTLSLSGLQIGIDAVIKF